MPLTKSVLVIFSFVFTVTCAAQRASSANPLLIHSNSPIEFTKIDAAVVKSSVADLIRISDERVKKIIGTVKGNTFSAFDELQYDINDLSSKLQVISATYPDDSTRNAAEKGSEM